MASTPLDLSGLTPSEVEERVAAGQTNTVAAATSRTVGDIVRANVLTRFNAILGTLLIVILIVGPLIDALFGLVLVANTLIGIIQELRAKQTLDRLALLVGSKATVVRDGSPMEVERSEVVLDDLLTVGPGDEVVVDAVVVEAVGLQVDESFLSGESEPVPKAPDDEVLSGSFVSAGSGHLRAIRVGEDAYLAGFDREARRFSLVRSELRSGINQILRYVTWVMIPAAVLLVGSQLIAHESLPEAIRSSVGGLVGMIPEGLVLLTSVAFAVGVVRLGRQQVLVNELAAIEGLARVDILCLDKTGTLTDGTLTLASIEPGETERDPEGLRAAIGALAAADPRPNGTLRALALSCPDPGWALAGRVPFSSDRKWSAIDAGERGVWVLGAPDVILSASTTHDGFLAAIDAKSATGRRVVLVAAADHLDSEELPTGVRPVGLVELEEQVRPSAAGTIEWFGREGVELRVISGDHPATVSSVAARVGIDGEGLDARDLGDPESLGEMMENNRVFGRVVPDQKRSMVSALQSNGHVVAMTGDGVNDVLALKEADLGIAMGSGSPATRAVGRLVLLDNAFDRLPGVVAEGRRVIANIERVANLFLTKTVYVTVLSIAVGVLQMPFPFYPRHLTLISSLTIGIPAFFLALAPNTTMARPGFVKRVLEFAVPAGVVAAVATLAGYAVAHARPGVDLDEARTVATLTLFIVGMWVLAILARPYTMFRRLLIGSLVGVFTLVFTVPQLQSLFALEPPEIEVLAWGAATAGVACLLLELAWRFTGWVGDRRQKRLE
jgi:cation-transporting ATPase E